MRKLFALLAGAAVVGLFWKEFPALRRYIKIEKM
ncbi:hypothetical protein GA0074695_3262 [Micromonospora viridifaciens]|uniref:Uncharacterized protein n=1 Tax=Micromonospora viridifaciens TaxID=1881 RepID=A0A1C4XFC7_MICVI|nr:hypothetical protein GA0074695_3262 [Micromonospora viridifaciens]